MNDQIKELREALEMAIEDLTSATSFLSKKSRDRQSKTLRALRAALSNLEQTKAAAYFSYGDDSGYVEHETAESAIKQAQADLKGYTEDAMQDNEWPIEVESVCWGIVLQKTSAVDNSEAAGQPSFEYELGRPVTDAPPATQASNPVA
jgi:hypothetical protein